MNPINNLLEKLIDRLMPSDEGLPYDEVHAPLDQIEEAMRNEHEKLSHEALH